MGWGLGKNSPIVLSLGRSNYEAMLDRHGQNVRWRISKMCTCIKGAGANSADPQCKKCGGSGERYDYQKYYTDTMRLKVTNHILELPADCADGEVLKAYDATGAAYTIQQMGQYIALSNPHKELKNGEIVEIVFRRPLFQSIAAVVLEPIGNGFYRVPGVLSDQSTIEGVEYRSPGDIIAIEAVFDAHNQEVDIIEYRRDTVRLKDEEATGSLTALKVNYIKPFRFFVLSQNLSEADEKLLAVHEGDAICTFPYALNVSENDVITVLSGSQTKKIVLRHKSAARDDTLPEYFVDEVSYLETDVREYAEGIDFILVGENKLHWVCEDAPAEGMLMAITYRYLPTYRVHKAIPMLRTSEDQRMPKKVILKLFSALSESRGVNKQ